MLVIPGLGRTLVVVTGSAVRTGPLFGLFDGVGLGLKGGQVGLGSRQLSLGGGEGFLSGGQLVLGSGQSGFGVRQFLLGLGQGGFVGGNLLLGGR